LRVLCEFVKDVKDQFEITADPVNAASARARLRRAAADAGFSGVALDDLEVAMGEALSNAILHGSPTPASHISICITFALRTREFSVEVTDSGVGFDPAAVRRTPGDDEINGRGLKMMAILVDKAVLFHDGSGMTVRLTKHVPERM
jgi:anti-sigma regulatory factor (Ser/Thr protein kinase)